MSHEQSLYTVDSGTDERDTERPTDPTDADAQGRGVHWRLFERLGRLFYPLRQLLGISPSKRFEQRLVAAEIPTPAELYVAGALGVGVVLGTLAGVLGLAAGVWLLGIPSPVVSQQGLLLAMTGISPVLTAAIGGYAGMLYYPRSEANRRAREIELGLSDLVSFMYTLSVSGMNVVEVFEAAGEAETEYGEAAREFQRLVQRMNYFGTDYRTAIEHVRDTTPSDDLAKFLTDLLSVLDSGGDIQTHLDREKDEYLQEAERAQEAENDRIELLGHVYMVAKLAPILLLIMYVIIMFTGQSSAFPLLMIVYVLMPLLAAGYFVMLSTITADRVGEGRVATDRDLHAVGDRSMLGADVIDRHADMNPGLFSRASAQERLYNYRRILRHPATFWKERPLAVLWVTLPITAVALGALVLADVATLSIDGFVADHTIQTVVWVYLPAALNLGPLAVFYEWNLRDRRAITRTLTADLRKLGEANRFGDNLREAFAKVGETSDSRLGAELGRIETARAYGIPTEASIVSLANRYEAPRLARIMKIIKEAQKADKNISEVIETAADLSRIQDELEADRKARTQQQATIIAFSFFVFIVIIMILLTFFQPLVAGASSGEGTQQFLSLSVDPDLMGTIYLHALVVDAIGTGVVTGYIRSMDIAGSVKYILGYLVMALAAWLTIPPLIDALGVVPTV